jgi:hypothetical protein
MSSPMERDAIRSMTSRGIPTVKSLLETNSKELARARGITFSSSNSLSYQHVYRWKRAVPQRQTAADSDHRSMTTLPPTDHKLQLYFEFRALLMQYSIYNNETTIGMYYVWMCTVAIPTGRHYGRRCS